MRAPGHSIAASKFFTSQLCPAERASRSTSDWLVVRCQLFSVLRDLGVARQIFAFCIWVLAVPALGQAQELGNKDKELNISAQPVTALSSVEVGSGSGSSHTVTILSVVSRQSSDSSSSDAISIEEQSLYDGALERFQQARYLDAAQQFVGFLTDHPHSALADHAWYWLAESRYLERGFDDAVTALTTLLDYFPGSVLSGAAQLRLGYSYYELRRYPEARKAVESLLEGFPNGDLAVLAKGLLEELKAQGH